MSFVSRTTPPCFASHVESIAASSTPHAHCQRALGRDALDKPTTLSHTNWSVGVAVRTAPPVSLDPPRFPPLSRWPVGAPSFHCTDVLAISPGFVRKDRVTPVSRLASLNPCGRCYVGFAALGNSRCLFFEAWQARPLEKKLPLKILCLVPAVRLELTTPCLQGRCCYQLSYTGIDRKDCRLRSNRHYFQPPKRVSRDDSVLMKLLAQTVRTVFPGCPRF